MTKCYQCFAYNGRFPACSSVVYIKYTPSSQVKNRSILRDPAVDIYCRTGSYI